MIKSLPRKVKCILKKTDVWVSSGYCNKTPRTGGGLNDSSLFLTVLEAGRKSKIKVLDPSERSLSWLPDGSLLAVSSQGRWWLGRVG